MDCGKILEMIIRFFSRTDVSVSVFTALVALLLTYFYMTFQERKLDERAQRVNEKNKKVYEEKDMSKDRQEEGSETDDDIPPLLSDKQKKYFSRKEVDKYLLDSEDMEMIKKGEHLDTKDPSAVKHYVQEMRSMSYKGKNLTDVEKQREEEVKQQQLAQIFALMNQEKEKFGETTIDELKEQMTMYNN